MCMMRYKYDLIETLTPYIRNTLQLNQPAITPPRKKASMLVHCMSTCVRSKPRRCNNCNLLTSVYPFSSEKNKGICVCVCVVVNSPLCIFWTFTTDFTFVHNLTPRVLIISFFLEKNNKKGPFLGSSFLKL